MNKLLLVRAKLDREGRKTFVMDLGFNEIDRWFIIEFNSAWGAGLNGCDLNKVIDCVIAATIS